MAKLAKSCRIINIIQYFSYKIEKVNNTLKKSFSIHIIIITGYIICK